MRDCVVCEVAVDSQKKNTNDFIWRINPPKLKCRIKCHNVQTWYYCSRGLGQVSVCWFPEISTPGTISNTLPDKWEVHWSTNKRPIAVLMRGVWWYFLQGDEEPGRHRNMNWGGMLPYKLEVYWRTSCTGCAGWWWRQGERVWGEYPSFLSKAPDPFCSRKVWRKITFVKFKRDLRKCKENEGEFKGYLRGI